MWSAQTLYPPCPTAALIQVNDKEKSFLNEKPKSFQSN